MSWSLGEAQTLGVKAARGAGLPWGLAEEAGAALRWLEARGLPGAAALAAYLPTIEEADGDRIWAFFDHGERTVPLCPIRLGATLMDFGAVDDLEDLGDVRQPLLLAPFLSAITSPIALEWFGVRLIVDQKGAIASDPATPLLIDAAHCTLGPASGPVSHGQLLRRCPDSAAAAMAALATFAARTYAPATEASRLAGAGAGTSDND